MEGHRVSKSQARWSILKNAVVNKRFTHRGDPGFSESVRSFTSHKLFTKNQCSCIIPTPKGTRLKPKQDMCRWFSYFCNDLDNTLDIWIQHPDSIVIIDEALIFNNTGNVCIWPTEEVMAYYCLSQIEEFHEKSVVELGGGSSSLAGMAVAMNSASSVLLTDGNKKCVENLKEIINMNCSTDNKQDDITEINESFNVNIMEGDLNQQKNNKPKKQDNLDAALIRWDDISTFQVYKEHFDYVICSDCLFFQEFHDALIDSIDFILKPGGIGLIFAPKRGNTFDAFMKKCVTRFQKVTESDDYNYSITRRHQIALKENENYDSNLHYPILLKIYKSYHVNSDKENRE